MEKQIDWSALDRAEVTIRRSKEALNRIERDNNRHSELLERQRKAEFKCRLVILAGIFGIAIALIVVACLQK